MVKDLAPALFCTGKTNFYRVMLYFLQELHCAPEAVYEALVSMETATANLAGTSPFGNFEQNEALDETGVACTKQNASYKSAEPQKKSFYTSGSFQKADNSLRPQKKREGIPKEWTPSNVG